MANFDGNAIIEKLDTAQNGAETRVPIVDLLNRMNDSGGNTDAITDGTKYYTYEDFMTPEEVYQYFIKGEGLIDDMPTKASERKKAVTSRAIYRQLVILSNILNKVIGIHTEEPEPDEDEIIEEVPSDG